MNRILNTIGEFAEEFPDSIAVGLPDENVTYSRLFKSAQSVASWLVHEGLGRNERVALCFERDDPELYFAMLGVLIAGGCFVPVSSKLPIERQAGVVLDSGAVLVFASKNNFERAENIRGVARFARLCDAIKSPYETPVDIELPNSASKDLAYVLFTSGTTGSPKGVMVNRGNFESFIEWGSEYVGAVREDRFSNHSETTFDLSLFDLFVAWNSGASVYPIINTMERSCPGEFILRNRITIWFSVPSVIGMMKVAGQMNERYLKPVRRFLFCGEPLLSGQVKSIREVFADAVVDNLYGPTEATIACSAYSIPKSWAEGDEISIGRRTAGTEIFVWNQEESRCCAQDEIGEIYISGDQVGPGYLDSPDANDRFLEDPRFRGAGVPCYRSGDLGIEGPEGILCRGRVDDQIKFRGWRIELSEIDEALSKVITNCRSIAILLNPNDPMESQLIAVVEGSPPDQFGIKEILSDLEHQLPSYMIPSEVRSVLEFPLNSNGKIDRKSVVSLVEGSSS